MNVTIPENGIYGMTDAELQAAIDDAERREVLIRNLLSELRLHRMMRRHVKAQHIKENIAAMQRQLEEMEASQ